MWKFGNLAREEFMTTTRLKSEHLSSKTKVLEDNIKERYGQKRGRAMITAAKQAADYQDLKSEIEWTRVYEKELEARY